MKEVRNQWPLGPVPKEWQRPEIDQLKAAGYEIDDARDAVTLFENKIAEWAGSKYAVAVDSCTNALFLCIKFLDQWQPWLLTEEVIAIPARTYISVPMTIINAGMKLRFEDRDWSGSYSLNPLPVIDSAARFTESMHVHDTLTCLSFQFKKRLPIGKGGMILTDNLLAAQWFRKASFEGRDLSVPQWDDHPTDVGWNMYMTPEDAARGILIFDQLDKVNPDSANQDHHPDLSKIEFFKEHTA
jgi:dTDP-4-amino-4,6-dideoxygalactose transaminase